MSTRKFESMRLDAFVDNILEPQNVDHFEEDDNEGAPPKYAGNNRIDAGVIEEMQLKAPFWLFKNGKSEVRAEDPSLWIGGGGTVTPMHADHSNDGNYIYQLLGEKALILYPPHADSLLSTVCLTT